MSLSSSIDRAVKAYIDHTNVVLAGDASLDVSMLQQPFHDIAAPQLAQLALAHQQQDAQAAVPPTDADGKKKRNYKPRDPNAPKRPLTAYFRYLQEQRAPLAEQMAKINDAPSKPGDISKAATERWKSMSEEEQAPYKAAYQRALKDYEREVASYKAGGEGAEPAEQQQVNGAAQQDDDAESETDSDESSEEEEAKPMPPPAPKVASPEVKKTPKSAMKKTKNVKPAEDFPATPQFSSINPSVPIPSSQQKSSSPELKRKASGDAAAEEGTKKKRGRKSKAEKEAEAAAAAAAAAAPAVPASDASSEKPKKEKKKKRKSEA